LIRARGRGGPSGAGGSPRLSCEGAAASAPQWRRGYSCVRRRGPGQDESPGARSSWTTPQATIRWRTYPEC